MKKLVNHLDVVPEKSLLSHQKKDLFLKLLLPDFSFFPMASFPIFALNIWTCFQLEETGFEILKSQLEKLQGEKGLKEKKSDHDKSHHDSQEKAFADELGKKKIGELLQFGKDSPEESYSYIFHKRTLNILDNEKVFVLRPKQNIFCNSPKKRKKNPLFSKRFLIWEEQEEICFSHLILSFLYLVKNLVKNRLQTAGVGS